ncbi:MAG: putative dehydrogenase [Saprospiraceae bacterium]|jgi:predicted dehydrogenase
MKWGLLGYGRIAAKFEQSIEASQKDTIVAAASRSQYLNIPKTYKAFNDYDRLLEDDEVEIVYICTTHNTHKQLTIAALNAGKHVLCEKPMSTSASDVKEMTECAEKNNRFLMEAIWSRYLPGYQEALRLIRAGAIGEVKMIQANFGFRMNPEDPKERLINKELAGGAIWDVGIYPISFAMDICQSMPTEIQALGKLNSAGVEETAILNLSFPENVLASLTCSFEHQLQNDAIITGTKGRVTMKDFWKCEDFSLKTEFEETAFEKPMVSSGYYHEILGCSSLIEMGEIQSPLISWQDSWEISSVMDSILTIVRE